MFHFFAYISRMKLINRWSLMRCIRPENVQEHSHQVAVIAHALALIQNKYFGGTLSPDRISTMALYHDVTEVLTGDLPTPVKYFSGDIRTAYKDIEGHAAKQLLALLPDDLRSDYRQLILGSDDIACNKVIKAAAVICAYIKCLEEGAAGNSEFSGAKKTIEAKIKDVCADPAVKYFCDHFLPSFALTLDEMSEPIQL